jgi:DNA repair exonuclease SbcCD ATPase subunit
LKEEDITLKCRQCGKEFLFTKAEQEFYKEKGFNTPRRCKECRTTEKTPPEHPTCSKCGVELVEGTSAYCHTCLTNIELESEMKAKKTREALSQARTGLKSFEAENTELKEALDHEKQLVVELTQNIDALNEDLEKMNQLHSALDEWFKPVLGEIEARLSEKLKDLELGQNRINERMLQLVQKMHEMRENTTLFEIIKQSFRHHQKEDKQPI